MTHITDFNNHTYSTTSRCSTKRLVWRAPDLWRASSDLTVRMARMSELVYLMDYWPWGKVESLGAFAQHMQRVQGVCMDYPLIFGERGELMDGAHRWVKAYLEGRQRIAVVRFKNNPPPSYTEAL